MSKINCVYDSNGCQVCPDIPVTPYTPSRTDVQPIIGWNAGANSVTSLDGNVRTAFDMPPGVSGAVVGFKSDRTQQDVPNLVQYGFYFQRVGATDVYQVIERGVTKTNVVARAGGETFEIARSGGSVVYLVNGAVVYRSQTPSGGPLLVNACLYTSGDAVGNAA